MALSNSAGSTHSVNKMNDLDSASVRPSDVVSDVAAEAPTRGILRDD